MHKFGKKGADNYEQFIADLKANPTQTIGEMFVFIDECHRTQSGRLHETMKALMPNAVLMGFTGTPLLKKDKQTSLEVFGKYIHTYLYKEAVEDKVVLDLVYEARDIDQSLTSQESVDEWFDLVSQDLNDWQKDELRKHWGTFQKVQSSESRMNKVVRDIIKDFRKRPRLSDGRGTAMLVASSIYEACKYFALFQKTPFKSKCAIVTSYNPYIGDTTTEETGAGSESDKQFIYNTYEDALKEVTADGGKSKAQTYEDEAKRKFKEEPANMKLLIVVNKLLTGFDAPTCTYLYIDKSMEDHGLFQAICRTNRLDGEDKEFGYIVDYKDLFKKVENAIAVYTSELDTTATGTDPNILLQNRLTKGRERLENAREMFRLLCEPVPAPRGHLEYQHYFCGNTEVAEDLKEREPFRVALYRAVVGFVRAYANIADELEAAGYSTTDKAQIKAELDWALKLRDIVRLTSDETLDLKTYESDMRHLIDSYIQADEPRKVSELENFTLLELIVRRGIEETVNALPDEIKGSQESVAEIIENNVRTKIIKEHLSDPAYYEKMSELLQEIIADRKAKANEYAEYLKRVAELAQSVETGNANDVPQEMDSPSKRALYHNLLPNVGTDGDAQSRDKAAALAMRIDAAVKKVKPDDWRGNAAKETIIKAALYEILNNAEEVERIFAIIVPQKDY